MIFRIVTHDCVKRLIFNKLKTLWAQFTEILKIWCDASWFIYRNNAEFFFLLTGACDCDDGFIGDDCSGLGPPSIPDTTPVTCDSCTEDCIGVTINGAFTDVSTMTCRLTAYQVRYLMFSWSDPSLYLRAHAALRSILEAAPSWQATPHIAVLSAEIVQWPCIPVYIVWRKDVHSFKV